MRRSRSAGFHRRLSAPLAFAAVALATLMLTAGPAAAYQQFHTTATVNVRSSPDTSTTANIVGQLSSGSTFNLVCQVQNGPSVGGNRTWDMIATSGNWRFISDYYTNTPSFNSQVSGTPDCSKV